MKTEYLIYAGAGVNPGPRRRLIKAVTWKCAKAHVAASKSGRSGSIPDQVLGKKYVFLRGDDPARMLPRVALVGVGR